MPSPPYSWANTAQKPTSDSANVKGNGTTAVDLNGSCFVLSWNWSCFPRTVWSPTGRRSVGPVKVWLEDEGTNDTGQPSCHLCLPLRPPLCTDTNFWAEKEDVVVFGIFGDFFPFLSCYIYSYIKYYFYNQIDQINLLFKKEWRIENALLNPLKYTQKEYISFSIQNSAEVLYHSLNTFGEKRIYNYILWFLIVYIYTRELLSFNLLGVPTCFICGSYWPTRRAWLQQSGCFFAWVGGHSLEPKLLYQGYKWKYFFSAHTPLLGGKAVLWLASLPFFSDFKNNDTLSLYIVLVALLNFLEHFNMFRGLSCVILVPFF